MPSVNCSDAVRALEKAGFRSVHQGKHIVMFEGVCIITVLRSNPVNAYTMGGMVRAAGPTVEGFR